MIELVFPAPDLAQLRTAILKGGVEYCAILYASPTRRSDGTIRLLARELYVPSPSEYTRQSASRAELSPTVVALVTKRARREGLALVFVHSHLSDTAPVFSPIDARGERDLATFLALRHPDTPHLALVVSEGGLRARLLGSAEECRVISVGRTRDVVGDPSLDTATPAEIFDRQVRAFGALGQRALQRLRIAVVGLGGTGSLVVQQLAHLGVRDFLLIDPDVVETTNLNRVVNAAPADVGHAKIDVAERYIHGVAGEAVVMPVQGDIIYARIAKLLTDTDVIFGCTDSHGSRAVLQQVAYQYLIPCIDMGTTIVANGPRVTYIYGRVQLLAPGLACLTCNGFLNASEVRRDMLTAFERQADPYLQGAHEPAPAVISLNGTVVSLAVTMLLAVVTGIPMEARHLLYNAMASSLRVIEATPQPDCYICSHAGALARGDAWPLLARQD